MLKQFKDQAAHFFAAIFILLLPFITVGGFILSAFFIGFTREQGQRWMTDRENAWKFWMWGKNSYLDLTFWTLGGVVLEMLLRW